MLDSSSDYMIRGVLLGLVSEAALTAVVSLVANFFISVGNMWSLAVCWGLTVMLSLAILLWKPVSALIFWTVKPSPFLLKEDYRAMIVGRIIGIVLGLGFGITIAGTLM